MISLGLIPLELFLSTCSDLIFLIVPKPPLERICENLVTREIQAPIPSIWTVPCFFMISLHKKSPSLRRVLARTLQTSVSLNLFPSEVIRLPVAVLKLFYQLINQQSITLYQSLIIFQDQLICSTTLTSIFRQINQYLKKISLIHHFLFIIIVKNFYQNYRTTKRAIIMELQRMYQTISHPHPFNNFKEYITPHQYADPKRQMMDRDMQEKLRRLKQGKFKATVKHKPCFMDAQIKHIKDNPGPSKYNTAGNLLQKRRYKSASLNKVDLKASKRTYIDNIQKYQSKKSPGVGKYNLLQKQKKPKTLTYKPQDKFSHLDDVYTLSAQRPGTGQYNPHKSVENLRLNRTDYKFYKQKHSKQEAKLKRSQSSKISPFSYNPIPFDSFAKIAKEKSKKMSNWTHGVIEKRKGALANTKSPGPAEYNLINQWIQSPNKKQPTLGKVKLLETFSKSARTLSVYN